MVTPIFRKSQGTGKKQTLQQGWMRSPVQRKQHSAFKTPHPHVSQALQPHHAPEQQAARRAAHDAPGLCCLASGRVTAMHGSRGWPSPFAQGTEQNWERLQLDAG